MIEGHYLSWEEVQRLALPPNATMLVPPPPEPVDVAAAAAGPPRARPDWLDDDGLRADPEAERAAAEQAEYGPGPVRLLASLIAVNAVLTYAHAPRTEDEKQPKPPRRADPEPDADR